MKKIYFILLVLCISTTLFAQTFESGGINYNVTSPTTVEVSYPPDLLGKVKGISKLQTGMVRSYKPSPLSNIIVFSGIVVIPATVSNGGTQYDVTRIGDGAFGADTDLTAITIPSSVTTIGVGAFAGCTGLTTITIPNSVTTISNYTFNNCSSLSTVIIPNTVTIIGDAAFGACTALNAVTIPNSVTTIGDSAFSNCTSLSTVTVPNSVTTIGEGAFRDCTSLTAATISIAVTTVSKYMFLGCTNLASITILNSVTTIGFGAFIGCSSLSSLTIPNSVTTIGENAFTSCTSLSTLTISNYLTTISNYTFNNCSSLSMVIIPNSVTTIGEGAFRDCTSLTSITIPNSVSTIGFEPFRNCTSLTSVTVNWLTPLPIYVSTFLSVNLNNVTLNVPAGKAAVYDAAAVWTNFNPIVEQVENTTWNGTAWSNGTPTATKNVIFTGNYLQIVNLTSLSVELRNTAIVIIPSGFNLTVTNGITVASTASLVFENNANLLQTTNANNTGNITYKRDASMKRLDYVLWSSPVAGQKLLDFTPNTFVNRFYTFNEPTNSYVQVASPATTNFEVAKGYSLRAPNNFLNAPAVSQTFVGIYTGVPNNGEFVVPVTFTASPTGGIGYNLIGNPYPSTVSGNAFLNANSGSIYFWTHQSFYNSSNVLVNGGFANYASMNLSGSVAATVNNGVNITPNGFIQVGQGFMFLTTTNKNVIFRNDMRATNNADQFFRTANQTENNKLWLNLTNNSGVFSQTMVAYLPNTTIAFDDGYDAMQINTSGNVLSSQIGAENYAIQSRGSFDSADVVQLNLNIATAGSYTLSKDNTNGIFSNNQDFFLEDNLTGLTHNIKQSPYTFVIDAGANVNRFSVVFQNATLSNNTNVFEKASVIVFEQNGTLNISATEVLKAIKVFDIQGRNIFEMSNINAKTATLNNFIAKQQVLMVQITNSNNEVVTKKVIF